MLDSSANDRHIDGCGCSACQAEPQFEFVEDRNPQAASPTFSNSQVIGQISSSSVWSGNSISFGFLQSSPSWDIGYEGDGFSAFNSTQISATRLGISLWDDLINDSFVEAVSNQQNANIKFGNTTTYISFAHAYFPGGSPWAGEVWLNANTYTYLQFPDVLGEGSLSYAYMTIIHEIGHALGLNHPGNYNGGSPTYANDAEYAQDTHQWTVMSYFSASNTGADWNGGDGGWGYAQTPMVHDILTIQSMYGADTSTRSDSTTYGFNTDTNLAVYDFTQNSAPRLTIYDAGGIDTLDLSGFQNRAIINLQPGTYSSAGGTTSTMTHNIGIAHNTWIENAIGGSGNDTIYGNALTNTLTGNAGNDSLYGYDGNDTFFGGSGTDWVYFEGALLDYVVTVLDTSLEFLDTFTDSVWNDVEWIQFTDASYTYSDLENLFREEIEIESNGVLKLLILGGRYRLEDTDGTTSEITYNGSPVGPNTFAGWQATQVEANNNGGYDLLFLHTNGSNIVWQLDNSGVHIGHNLVSPDELIDYETVFNVDLNSDGQLGHVTTTVEDAGSYKLLSQSSGKYLIENAEGTTSEITYNGSPVGPNTFAGWQATQVEANNNGGYDLLFLHTNGSNIVWQLDNSGVHIGHNLVSPDELIDYETVFNVDLNSDGQLGHVTTTVEDAGSYKLLSQSSGKYLIENAEGTTSEITYNGSPVGPNTFAGWQATQVEANNNGGYDLLFLHTNGSNIVWQLDNSGVHIGHNLVSPDELIDYETVFNVDLNSDGQLGHVTTTVEDAGSYKLLSQSSGKYLIENAEGTTSEITYNGSPVGPNTFAGWQATQVEANNNGGYDLLFLHTNGSNIVWQLDNSGVHIGHNLVSPDELIDYETVFNVDLNSDGHLGVNNEPFSDDLIS